MNANRQDLPAISTQPEDTLSLAEYAALRRLYSQQGANFGYNTHDLPSIGHFPAATSFRHSTQRLEAATRSGDTALDEMYRESGRQAALSYARNDALNPPAWIDMDRVRRGQQVGRRYFTWLSITLGNLSLIGGFGASKINRVLVRGSRLSLSSSGRGYDPIPRLVETAAWLLDALRSVDFGSRGFEETIKVRALHSMIRGHLLDMEWDVDAFDHPINQEQMLSTLMGFSYNGIWGLRHLGIHISATEAEDYIHLWAYIGHMLGIDEDFLPRSFDDAKATTLQLLPRILDPDDDTRDIIRNLHNRRNIRIGLPHVVQAAMCRFFLPHSYADLLGLHGNAVVDRGVGIIYRSLGQVVSAVGQFRPDALEAWEIKRVSRRLENVLNAMRNNATEDLQEQHAVNKSLTLLKELSRAILSV